MCVDMENSGVQDTGTACEVVSYMSATRAHARNHRNWQVLLMPGRQLFLFYEWATFHYACKSRTRWNPYCDRQSRQRALSLQSCPQLPPPPLLSCPTLLARHVSTSTRHLMARGLSVSSPRLQSVWMPRHMNTIRRMQLEQSTNP